MKRFWLGRRHPPGQFSLDVCVRQQGVVNLSGWARAEDGSAYDAIELAWPGRTPFVVGPQPRPDVAQARGGSGECGFFYYGAAPQDAVLILSARRGGQAIPLLELPPPRPASSLARLTQAAARWRYYAGRAWAFAAAGQWQALWQRVRQFARPRLNQPLDAEAWRWIEQHAACLVLDHGLGGGAGQYLAEQLPRWQALDAQNRDHALVLSFHPLRLRFELAALDIASGAEVRRFRLEAAALPRLIATAPVAALIYNNAVGYPDVLAVVAALVARKRRDPGVWLELALHDQFALCPSPHLIGRAGYYCGLPDDPAVCAACLADHPEPIAAWYAPAGLTAWRRAWGELLAAADRIRYFTPAMRELVARAYPALDPFPLEFAPHLVPPLSPEQTARWQAHRAAPPRHRNAPTIALVGAITHTAKGNRLAAALIEYAAHAAPAWRWHVIGTLTPAPRVANAPANPAATTPGATPCYTATGPYRREELTDRLIAADPDLVLFPSVAPETFSYVLHELARYELPIAAYPIGAQADFLARYPHGVALPWPPEPISTWQKLRQALEPNPH